MGSSWIIASTGSLRASHSKKANSILGHTKKKKYQGEMGKSSSACE